MRRRAFAFALATGGCGAVFGIPSDVEQQAANADASAVVDGGASEATVTVPSTNDVFVPDAPIGPTDGCDLDADFGPPETVTIGSGKDPVVDGRLENDELTIYFASQAPDTKTYDIFTATRVNRNAPFEAVTKLDGVSTDDLADFSPNMSADGLTIVWNHGIRVARATRKSKADAFSGRVEFVIDGVVEPGVNVFWRPERANELWFGAGDGSTDEPNDVFFSAPGETRLEAVPVAEVSEKGKNDQAPVISADGRTLYFARVREKDAITGKRFFDVHVATRATDKGTFSTPTIVKSLVGAGNVDTLPTWISPDSCRLYMWRQTDEVATTQTILVATRPR